MLSIFRFHLLLVLVVVTEAAGCDDLEDEIVTIHFYHHLDFAWDLHIMWITVSICEHLATKEVLRIVAGGIGDAEKKKAPVRLTSIY
ncbi:hypothetical protein HS088_TW01G00415 [Tripterygium wilfordii]|uniref:Uncharacterized protein n=1 Tax=Tripterygium wilfordii TaxID=458696 RepID=A0A7J7E1V1_TRIWF|nr:hypothetical protein HS088_TW01G00415 [Tripterygium wilfordii]